jgi:hypothetical protein
MILIQKSRINTTTSLAITINCAKMIVQAIVSTAIALALRSTVEAFSPRSAVAARGGGKDAQARWVGEEVLVTPPTVLTMQLLGTRIKSEEGSARESEVSRRNWLQSTSGGLSLLLLLQNGQAEPARAATPPDRVPLEELLYRILRVREATQQETRLIKTGKFKDVQRANVKLAVKFMIENYRLADAFVQASTYLEGGTARRVEAGQVGQGAVQSLYTILEYFDASDVQNIKVRFARGMNVRKLSLLWMWSLVGRFSRRPISSRCWLLMSLTGRERRHHVREGRAGPQRPGRGAGQH